MLPIIRTENAREGTGFGEIVSLVSDILSLSISGCIEADTPIRYWTYGSRTQESFGIMINCLCLTYLETLV